MARPLTPSTDDHLVRVLLVEDDEDDYLLTSDLLAGPENTYQLHWSSTFRDGLDHLQHESVDVCLIDYRIGARTGLEFVRDALARGSEAPMILLTGISDRDVDLAAAEVGAADYLDKGALSAALLERSIRYALRRAEDIRALKQATEALADAKADLEAQVEARTSELVALNQDLQREIEERSRMAVQLQHDAFHDRLTQLPNRELLLDRVSHAMQRAQRPFSKPYAVLLLNLDRFETINDALGHAAGDQLLLVIARRLRALLRPGDTLARVGGDDFACLVEEVTLEGAQTCAGRLQKALEDQVLIDAQEIYCTASIGIALSTNGYVRPESMLHDATLAMHAAKARGRDRSEVFEVAMRARSGGKLRLESDLRRALKQGGELKLHYQPIVGLADERVVGFEALIRWRHPDRGLIAPGEFVPIAEETGLILPIGKFVLATATETLGQWCQDAGTKATGAFISVNISPRQLSDNRLVGLVTRGLEHAGIAPDQLRLEITESTLMADPAGARRVLDKLKALGVGLAIDDFGTGYSSLGYLRQFPFDVVKIDRALISTLTDGQADRAIVETILNLAEVLGMTVVAEGVETRAEVDCLRAMGCQMAQGFYYARALPPAEAVALLTDQANGALTGEAPLAAAG